MSELACKPFGAWRVGDTVRCVDANSSADRRLVYGSPYSITSIDTVYSRISMDGIPGYWNHEWFEWVAPEVEPVPDVQQCPAATDLISVGDKLRCRDDSFSRDALRVGNWYTVTHVDRATETVLVAGSTVNWVLSRFDQIIRFLRAPAVVPQPNPYTDWKSGDSVRCLNASASWGMLAEQHVYEIDGNLVWRDDCGPGIHLVGIPSHEWDCNRFERVAPIVDVHSEPDKPVVRVGSRVRCDDASGTDVMLVEGNVYTVASVQRHDCDTFLRLNDVIGMGWNISRFTLLPDEVDPVVPASQADLTDAVLMPADEARRLADEHFMANGRELRLAIKAAIDAAVAAGESSANMYMSDSVYYAAQRWLAKSGYHLSSPNPCFTRRTISWE